SDSHVFICIHVSILNEVAVNLENVIKEAVIESGLVDTEKMSDIVLEEPKSKSHGDFATDSAMRLAKVAKKAPRQIAEEIVNDLNKEAGSIESVDITERGFINFFMKDTFFRKCC